MPTPTQPVIAPLLQTQLTTPHQYATAQPTPTLRPIMSVVNSSGPTNLRATVDQLAAKVKERIRLEEDVFEPARLELTAQEVAAAKAAAAEEEELERRVTVSDRVDEFIGRDFVEVDDGVKQDEGPIFDYTCDIGTSTQPP
ncbi:hypothetical protein JCM10296v2_001919 [Rhodotorula toruloides]